MPGNSGKNIKIDPRDGRIIRYEEDSNKNNRSQYSINENIIRNISALMTLFLPIIFLVYLMTEKTLGSLIFLVLFIDVTLLLIVAYVVKSSEENKDKPQDKDKPQNKEDMYQYRNIIPETKEIKKDNKEKNKTSYVDKIEGLCGKLDKEIKKIQDKKVRETVGNIISLSKSILKHVKDYPEELDSIRNFANRFLPSTLENIETYNLIVNEPEMGDTEKIKTTVAEIEEHLEFVQDVFTNLLEHLHDKIHTEVVTNITAMETMMKQDGLSKDL